MQKTKHTKQRSLSLSSETVRRLAGKELRLAVGGAGDPTINGGNTDSCKLSCNCHLDY
jgi:hypothetical protein